MRGLSKRKGSDIWQGRFRIPQRLWDRREDLTALGVSDIGKSQEFTRSTGQEDRDEAGEAYRKMLATWDDKMRVWESLLENGPQALTWKQSIALAGGYAKAFLEAHEEEPFDAPLPKVTPSLDASGDSAWIAAGKAMVPETRARFFKDLRAVSQAEEGKRLALILELMERYPSIKPLVVSDMAGGLEEMHGTDSDEALAAYAQHVDAASRRALNLDMLDWMGRAERGLERRKAGDFGGIAEFETLPVFDAKAKTSKASVKVTFNAIIDSQATKRKAGQGSKPMPEKSIKKYRRIAEEFAKHRKSSDAVTVKVAEVEAWMDSMLSAGRIGNRSISDRIVSLGTIINWGKRQREHREAMAQAEAISGHVELPSYVEKSANDSSYTLEEARTVLKAARKETDAGKRWLPWVCLYGGLRISEAENLRREDFFQVEGGWFFRVTSAGKRSLKTANSERVVPIHPALAAEGFLEWIASRSKGQLFRPSAYSYMSRWVRSKAVGITRKGVSPNHGLRHLFVALCRRDGVDSEAAEYLAGHATAKVHAKYGSTEVMLPGLAEEMRKIKPLLALGTHEGAN